MTRIWLKFLSSISDNTVVDEESEDTSADGPIPATSSNYPQ
jgi:hypothetical protein